MHFGAPNCSFLTGGATLGILTALSLAVPPGSKILVDRGCHSSVYNAMGLNDLYPVYLYSDNLDGFCVHGSIKPACVRKALDAEPDIQAVVITSPNYYGIVSDIAAIASVCSEKNVKLIVDEAHGAHFPFIDGFSNAVSLGADFSIASAHKTLPAPGQSALLFWKGEDCRRVKRFLSVYGTSSPSYYMLAALDGMRDYMQNGAGKEQYRRAIKRVNLLRRRINEQSDFIAMTPENTGEYIDPLRLTIKTMNGFRDAERLESIFSVVPEMADSINLVFILTGMDEDAEIDRLENSILSLGKLGGRGKFFASPVIEPLHAEIILNPRNVLFSPFKFVSLKNAAGCVSATHISSFPPSIPLIAAGERIEEKHLEILIKRGYDPDTKVAIVSKNI